MFSLRSSFAALRPRQPTLFAGAPTLRLPSSPPLNTTFARHRSQFAPRKVKWVKRHKGVIPIPIGGSTKGTTLAFGEWGIRIKGNGARLTGKQLQTVEELVKRKLKVVKGAKVYLRVFPDIPVCIKVCLWNRFDVYNEILTDSCREMKREWGRERVHSSFGRQGMFRGHFAQVRRLTSFRSEYPLDASYSRSEALLYVKSLLEIVRLAGVSLRVMPIDDFVQHSDKPATNFPSSLNLSVANLHRN